MSSANYATHSSGPDTSDPSAAAAVPSAALGGHQQQLLLPQEPCDYTASTALLCLPPAPGARPERLDEWRAACRRCAESIARTPGTRVATAQRLHDVGLDDQCATDAVHRTLEDALAAPLARADGPQQRWQGPARGVYFALDIDEEEPEDGAVPLAQIVREGDRLYVANCYEAGGTQYVVVGVSERGDVGLHELSRSDNAILWQEPDGTWRANDRVWVVLLLMRDMATA
eukprot:m51a1_g1057 hypothetical protein (229) ;mRNA; f:813229-814342